MNTQEKFDHYLDGLLNEKQVIDLMDQLRSDPELNREFIMYREAHQLLRKNLSSPILNTEGDPVIDEINLSEKIIIENDVLGYISNPENEKEKIFREEIRSLIRKKGRSYFPFNKNLLRVAAVLAVLIAVSTMFFIPGVFSEKKNTAQALFERYYNPIDDRIIQKYDAYSAIMQQAVIDFRESEFESASAGLDLISHIYDTEYMYHILKGLIMIEQDQPGKATEFLSAAAGKADNVNRFVAKWYLGLTYLKENDSMKAQQIFEELTQEKNPYRKLAKKIVRRMKN